MAQKRRKPWAKFPISRFPFSPSTYPGRRPRFSFLFTHEGIYRFSLRSLGRVLEERGVTPASERFAVLAYGSNACPTQLLNKYHCNNRLNDVPLLYGRLDGAYAVYARRKVKKPEGAYVPATLAGKRGSRWSWISLLTAEQLKAMDPTEGRPTSYALAEVQDVCFLIDHFRITPVYSYVNICGGVMVLQGRPVSLRSMGQRRCQLVFNRTIQQDARKWLSFKGIPNMQLPRKYSEILRR